MISSVSNGAVKRIQRLRKREWRERTGRFLVEGHRSVRPALGSGRIEEVLHTPAARRLRPDVLERAEADGARLREVSPEVMAHLTSLATAPDVLGIARIHEPPLATLPAPLRGTMLEGVRDPATAGSIMAATVATGGVVALFAPSTVDAFSPKVVRAAAGAHFALAVVRGIEPDAAAAAARASGARVVALRTTGPAPWEADLAGPLLLVVGSDEEPAAGADAKVAVPSAGGAPTLAQRAAVVLYEWVRQRGSG